MMSHDECRFKEGACMQGLVPVLNTPSTTPSTLQSIGAVCWPFGHCAPSARLCTAMATAAMLHACMHAREAGSSEL